MTLSYEPSILFFLFVAAVCVVLYYYLFFFIRFAFYTSKTHEVECEPVSVIIAARNEEDNLRDYLPHILEQEGVEFEVVVVNDRSQDHTAAVLRSMATPRLKIVNIPHDPKNTARGKKLAITLGVKAAKYDHLVFIDADCRPTSKHWLKHMAGALMKKPIALGVSPFVEETGYWKRFFLMDSAFIAVQYTSFALAGVPYMGVGRNMGYRKETFFEVGGFRSHVSLESGDDDLFVNEAANRKNVEIVLHPDALTVSKSQNSLNKWINQKLRHISTAPKYKTLHKILLAALPVSQYIAFGIFVVLLLLKINEVLSSTIFLLMLTTQQIVFFLCLNNIRTIENKAWSLIYVIKQPFVYLCVLFLKARRRIELWKQV